MKRILKIKTQKKLRKTQATNYLQLYKSQHRKRNTKNLNNMSPPQITNPIRTAPKETDLEKVPGRK